MISAAVTRQAAAAPSLRVEATHGLPTAAQIAAWIRDARERNVELIADLSEVQLLGERMPYVQPPKWEAAHAAWFLENRVLERALGDRPFLPGGAALYDSTTIPHRARWELPLPDKAGTLA